MYSDKNLSTWNPVVVSKLLLRLLTFSTNLLIYNIYTLFEPR